MLTISTLLLALLTAAVALTVLSPFPLLAAETGVTVPLSLILDYMPNIVYSDEPITFCLRVANPSQGAKKVDLRFRLINSKGETVWEKAETGEAKPQDFLSIETACNIFAQIAPRRSVALWPSKDKAFVLRVSLYVDGVAKEQDALSVRIVRSNENLPPLVLANDFRLKSESEKSKAEAPGERQPQEQVNGKLMAHLLDDHGNLVVLQIEHYAPKVNRKWAWIRWAYQQVHKEKIPRGLALVLGEESTCGDEKSYLDYLSESKDSDVYTIAVRSASGGRAKSDSLSTIEMAGGGSGATGSLSGSTGGLGVTERARLPRVNFGRFGKPILRSLIAFQRNILNKRPRLSVIMLGAEEVRYGADVLGFRKALEFIIQRLARRGCKHVVLIAPIVPPYYTKRARPYEGAMRKLATMYRFEVANLGDELGEKIWIKKCKVESVGSGTKVFTAYPVPSGHRDIAKLIAKLVNDFFEG